MTKAASYWAGSLALGALLLSGCEEPAVKKQAAPREKAEAEYTRLASYDLPKDWTRLAKPIEFSVASFQAGAGKNAVVITVSRLAGKAGGVVENIKRWRGKVGLAETTEEAILKDMKWLRVGGEKTPYVDLANPNKANSDRILGVVAERGLVTWFFKMSGPPEAVAQQKAGFEAFVESVKFGGTGANNG